MKIPNLCSKCFQESERFFTKVLPLADKGIYYYKCDKGHEEVIVLGVHHYEVLFQNGLWAIVDGYYREAISSFVAGLEGFYDFYIDVVSLKNGVDEDWLKKMKKENNRSEKKIGAYVGVYMNEEKQLPLVLDGKDSNFRNDVIHNGKIPTIEEAIEWAKKVQGMIKPVSKELLEKFPTDFEKATLIDIKKEWMKPNLDGQNS